VATELPNSTTGTQNEQIAVILAAITAHQGRKR